MRHFTKPLGMVLVMLALFVGAASRAHAQFPQGVISAWPDSVVMTADVGSSATANITVWQADTSQGNIQHTVHLLILGDPGFSLLGDSSFQFTGYHTITIKYAPTGTWSSGAMLEIVGEVNTAFVSLEGEPTQFVPQIQIQTGNYDSLVRNQQQCHDFSVYNPNSNAITITKLVLTDDPETGTQWSIANEVTLPATIASQASLTLGQICALLTGDSTYLYGSLEIDYTSNDSSYSKSVDLSGYGLPLNGTCVTADGYGFISDTLPEGGSKTSTFKLTNTTDSSVYLDSAEILGSDNGQFTINSPSFPLVLDKGASITVSITATMPSPAMKDEYYASFVAGIEGQSPDGIACNSVSVPLYALLSIPIADSITLEAPPGTNTLSITAHTTKSRHAIFIQNTGANQLLLQTLTIDRSDSMAFFVLQGSETAWLGDSLLPNSVTSRPIILTLEAPDTGTYDIGLTLEYTVQQAGQKGATPASNSFTYNVVAHRLPPLPAGVSEPNLPAPVDFTLSPNPAQGEVTIGLPEGGPSTVEVYDVLGNLVMSRVAQGEFVWNGESSAGTLANGTYIVRVSQGSYTSSKRLVIVR